MLKMGYTTYFSGQVTLDKPLTTELYDYLMKFYKIRHMKRDVEKIKEMGYEGDYGVEGEFFVEGENYNYMDNSIIDYNTPPTTQPGLWCQWIPTKDRMAIEWDEGEKFYCADEWMDYLLNKILAPHGYIANGKIYATGESSDDHWMISVVDNEVKVYGGRVIYEDEYGRIIE